MTSHVHNFRIHIGIQVFGRRAIAWVLPEHISVIGDRPQTWRCTGCGEQGYEIKETA